MLRPAVVMALVAGLAIGTEARHPQTAVAPVFEVASIRLNNSGSDSSSSDSSPRRYIAVNLPLRRLIAFAHRISPPFDRDRIIGPSWIQTTRYDINALLPANSDANQIPDMLRVLLVERFGLATHTEMREEQVYALVPARNAGTLGPQLTASSLDCSNPATIRSAPPGANTAADSSGAPLPCGIFSSVDGNGALLRGGGRTMRDLAANLVGRVNRTVIDRTGLTGSYDFTLRWTPDNFQNPSPGAGASRDGTPIVTALQAQLGLKLEPQRRPVEVLIVDTVERPIPD